MTITVTDFNKHGCPYCGSHRRHERASGPMGMLLKCASCGDGFVVVDDGVNRSPYGFGDPAEFPLVQPHPRRPAASSGGHCERHG